ncbi:dCTP deaminase domain-containing protein [Nostoc sp. CALU 546]|uniref:dCTP deaminase domain-containing protein n=1 Tax=Nostoc sp. CALU 546 TaxID=1867241 RepID=UPI003B67791D
MSILSDQDIKYLLNKEIVIYPYGEDCISPLGYDLRIGYAINLSDGHQSTVSEGTGKILIPARTSTFIITKEHVYLSRRIAGTLHARGSLAARGLYINSTTIDPNWGGQLTFLISNISDKPVELDVESRFVTLIFHRVNTPTLNGPITNPISVARQYGEIYGEYFANGLLSYLADSNNLTSKKSFEDLVQEAKKPTIYDIVTGKIIFLLTSFQEFTREKLSKFVTKILLIVPIGLILIGFTAQWYWNWLQSVLNLNAPYGLNIFMWQVTTVGVGVSLFISIINSMKNK